MRKKGFILKWDEAEELMVYLGSEFNLVAPNEANGYSINFEKLCQRFHSCSDACKYVVGIIEKPGLNAVRNIRFMDCVNFHISSLVDVKEVDDVTHSAAFATAVLLLAKINPSVFADYFETYPTAGRAEDKRAIAVSSSIRMFAKRHGIPLNGQNNCGSSCADCL